MFSAFQQDGWQSKKGLGWVLSLRPIVRTATTYWDIKFEPEASFSCRAQEMGCRDHSARLLDSPLPLEITLCREILISIVQRGQGGLRRRRAGKAGQATRRSRLNLSRQHLFAFR